MAQRIGIAAGDTDRDTPVTQFGGRKAVTCRI
jgi:hypothetical protein